jgi:hypothetical protein
LDIQMRFIFRSFLMLAMALPAVAQQGKGRDARTDIELRPVSSDEAVRFEIVVPDVASGRSQRRSITDLMLRVSLPGGDVGSALRLPNGATVDRDEGLLRAFVYVVANGRLMRPAEARCDRWVDDFTVCTLGCEGGVFGLKRRSGQGPLVISLAGGRLQRGYESGSKTGFALNACDEGNGADVLLAPSGGRPLAEVAMRPVK